LRREFFTARQFIEKTDDCVAEKRGRNQAPAVKEANVRLDEGPDVSCHSFENQIRF
jgi:hypothetical protein